MCAVRFGFITCFAFVATAACLFYRIDACLERKEIRDFPEQEHVKLLEEDRLYELQWNSKITPGLFYAVVNVSKEDYNHVDVIDVSENRLDGYVIDNLSILIQMILTGGDQCPCGKGTVITPRVIECGDLIDCSFNELTIKVYVTGHSEKDDFQILQVKYKTSPKPCDSLELKIQNMVIYAEYNQSDWNEGFGLLDTTNDSLELLRSHDYFTQLTFRSNKQYIDYQHMGSLRMGEGQRYVSWNNVTRGEFLFAIHFLRGPLLDKIIETEHFTNTDGYIKIEFDPCSPPMFCSRCLEKLMIDFVYGTMFNGPLDCPTNNGLSTIQDSVDLRYPNEPTIQHCHLSELMITVLPTTKNQIYKKAMEDFGGFSLNFDSIWTPCDKYLNCIGRDCNLDVI